MHDNNARGTLINKGGTVFVPVADQDLALGFYLDTLGFKKRADFTYGEDSRLAVWLDLDYEMIVEMGGPEVATRQALAQDGRAGKVVFLQRFHGIGDKYARNIWMDVYHPDFRNAIAVDASSAKEQAKRNRWTPIPL